MHTTGHVLEVKNSNNVALPKLKAALSGHQACSLAKFVYSDLHHHLRDAVVTS